MKRLNKSTASQRTTKARGGTRMSESSVFPTEVRSILVPIDFSEPSEKALNYAAAMAQKFGAKIVLLNVTEPFPTPDFAYYPLAMEKDKVAQKARRELERVQLKHELDPTLIEKLLVRHGVPYREITDAAKTLKVDLIVIATHGYSGLAHVFMGSTAERVVRHAHCPVLVVRGK